MIRVGRLHIVLPERLHEQAKVAARQQGKTLKDYVIGGLKDQVAIKPPVASSRQRRP